MKKESEARSTLSAIMEAVGLTRRKKLAPGGVRFLGMSGSFGRARIRHCATWDFEYKLPRVAARNRYGDFDNR